ncbi:type II secretion system protein, partial [Holdemania massiliensis]
MKRRNKGFTLIELIVVVAILVLLMLMLVPKLTGFTETAADTVCHANQLNAYKIMV